MLCLQPNGRWKKNATRCSYVINIVIIVIINNILYSLAFTTGTSGAHMLERRVPAACRSSVSVHTCKRGRADPAPCAGGWGQEGLPCSGASLSHSLLLLLVPAPTLPASWWCWLSPGLLSTFLFPTGRDPFIHSPALRVLHPYTPLGLYNEVKVCWCSSCWTFCHQRCWWDIPMVWSTSGQEGRMLGATVVEVYWLNLLV